MKKRRSLILLFLTLLYCGLLKAQDEKQRLAAGSLFTPKKDSLAKDTPVSATAAPAPVIRKDAVKKHDPRIATRRSAILPGWGQAYNREYWKIPIAYGILSIPTVLYFYNNSYYKKTKFAYEARYEERVHNDTSLLSLIDPELKTLSLENLQNYRNVFRRDRDYSILWFLLAWGLQVADATVFAHLKDFNVSDDLSMQIRPVFNPQTRGPGLSLSFNLRSTPRPTPIAR
ncbi:MAG: hypothetical protein JO301_04885 [Chitinophagaceae bacterium]|nr:hypothetical protein [Chitinophagaceae bacterium]